MTGSFMWRDSASSVESEISRTWSYKLGDNNWVELGSSFSGEFNLPYIDNSTTLELKIDIVSTNPVDKTKIDNISKSRIYSVKNHGELQILEPVSGSQILLTTQTPLETKVKGIYDQEITPEITWNSSNGEILNSNIIPETTGLTKVTGEFKIYQDFTKTKELTLSVVNEYLPEKFIFNQELTNNYESHQDGRFYGFSVDHKERVGEVTYVDVPYGQYWSNNRITKMYVALKESESFNYLVNNGLYRVKLEVGPLSRRDNPFIKLEENNIYIDTSYSNQIYTIETTVEVKDNKLTITGSENLQLISMEVQRVDKPIETVVNKMFNYRIMVDQKWYQWDPGHYYPDLRWDYNRKELVEITPNNKKGGNK